MESATIPEMCCVRALYDNLHQSRLCNFIYKRATGARQTTWLTMADMRLSRYISKLCNFMINNNITYDWTKLPTYQAQQQQKNITVICSVFYLWLLMEKNKNIKKYCHYFPYSAFVRPSQHYYLSSNFKIFYLFMCVSVW